MLGRFRMSHTIPSLWERVLAALFLASMWAVLALIALWIRLTSYGRIIETEIRIRDGQEIQFPRFRTTGPGTPEFRLLARLLRWSRCDELPAFWGIVRGDFTRDEISLFT